MLSRTFALIAGVAALVLVANADENPCDGLGGVQNLQRVENVVTWEPPQVSESCVVFYSVVHQDNGGSRQIIQTDTRYEFELISCASTNISVTATSYDVISQITTTLSFENPILGYIPAPIGIGILPGSTTAITYWQAAPVSIHACEITQFVIIVRSGDGPSLQNARVDVSDNRNRIFRVDLAELSPGRKYQLYAVAYAGNLQSTMSDVVEFTTQSD